MKQPDAETSDRAATDEMVNAINRSHRYLTDAPLTRSRMLSLGVGLVYLVGAAWAEGIGGILPVAGFLVFALSLIWFGEAMGQGWFGSFPRITKTTPGPIVTAAGWVLLLGPLLFAGAAALLDALQAR